MKISCSVLSDHKILLKLRTVRHSKTTFMQKEVEDALSLCMLGMTDLPFFRYDALKPSTDSMMSGGRMKLRGTRKKGAIQSC